MCVPGVLVTERLLCICMIACRYRTQGLDRTLASVEAVRGTAPRTAVPMCINCRGTTNQSDWAISVLLAYDRELSADEVMTVEDYLAREYAVTLGRLPRRPLAPGTCACACARCMCMCMRPALCSHLHCMREVAFTATC